MAVFYLPGTATQDKVLAGTTFSAGALYEAPGTMSNRAGINTSATRRTNGPFSLVLTPNTTGYFDATSDITITDGNFDPSNIKNGVTVLGLTGTYAGPIASGSTAVSGGQLTVSGLGFTPVIILTSYYYSSTQTAYLRTIGWGWNGSDQKHLIGVSGPSPSSSYFLDTAGGDLTPVSGGFTGWVAPAALSGGTCSWKAFG